MRSIKEVNVRGKTVLVRVDFNVPLKNNRVADDSRIRASLATIRFLIKKKAKVVLLSHLGRPDGFVDSLRLLPVAKKLESLLGKTVHYIPDCIGVNSFVEKLNQGEVVLLENLRFYSEEEKDDKVFAEKLASLGDIYVNDAFGVSHRAHASVHAITDFLPSFAGFLLQKEVKALSGLLKNPLRPFVVVLGGAKVGDKIGVIGSFVKKADAVLIGGAMMFTFLKSVKFEIGKSLFEPDRLSFAASLLKSKKIILPVDVVVKDRRVLSVRHMKKSSVGFDIGPLTAIIYSEIIKKAKTVFWNGPMGVFEVKPFDKGTAAVARAVSACSGASVIGGGDTISAVGKLHLKFTYVSTGGGASLEFLEGKKLPGIAVLKYGN